MKPMTTRSQALSVVISALLFSTAAMASETSLGLGAAFNDFGYRDAGNKTLPVPLINYENGDFYLHSLTAGYYLFRDGNDSLAVDVRWSPLSFDPDDSDHRAFQSLDKRRSTAMAGLVWTHHSQWGNIRASLDGDILDESNGVVGDLAYLYPIHSGNWTVVPGFGVMWNSSQQNKYYYGISGQEAARSGLNAYTPDDSWNPYMEVSVNYNFNEQWYAMASLRAASLSNEISRSDMVDNDMSSQIVAGIGYRF